MIQMTLSFLPRFPSPPSLAAVGGDPDKGSKYTLWISFPPSGPWFIGRSRVETASLVGRTPFLALSPREVKSPLSGLKRS